MSTIWAPVIAALGASFLTAIFGFGLEWWREWKAARSARTERRSRAYAKLLAESYAVMQLSWTFHVALEFKTGLREGLNLIMRISKPPDPLELGRWVAAELRPLREAHSDVWIVGSQEAIAAANDLVAACEGTMGVVRQLGKAHPGWLKVITGEKWSPEQFDRWQREMRRAREARSQLAEIARKELGAKAVDLLASNATADQP